MTKYRWCLWNFYARCQSCSIRSQERFVGGLAVGSASWRRYKTIWTLISEEKHFWLFLEQKNTSTSFRNTKTISIHFGAKKHFEFFLEEKRNNFHSFWNKKQFYSFLSKYNCIQLDRFQVVLAFAGARAAIFLKETSFFFRHLQVKGEVSWQWTGAILKTRNEGVMQCTLATTGGSSQKFKELESERQKLNR